MIFSKKLCKALCAATLVSCCVDNLSAVEYGPGLIGTVSTGGTEARVIVFNGSAAYVLNNNFYSGFVGSLAVLRLDEPANPLFIGTINTRGEEPDDLVLIGTTAYVKNDGNISIFNVANPIFPEFSGTCPASGSYIAVRGTTGYTNSFNKVDIINLSIPGSATYIGSVTSGGNNVLFVGINGTTGYAVNYSSDSVGILDISTPGSATFKGTVSSGGDEPSFITFSGTNAYVLNSSFSSGAIGILNIATPGSATLVGQVNCGGLNPKALAISGTTAYVTNKGSNNLAVFDISIPGTATFLGSVTTALVQPNFMAINGTLAYVTNDPGNSLAVYDVSNPGIPSFVGTVDSGGFNPGFIAFNGTLGYVVNGLSNGIVGIFGTSVPQPEPPPPAPPAQLPQDFVGPAFSTAEQINQMIQTGDYSLETLSFLQKLSSLQGQYQFIATTDAGSQHKVLQYQIEKLDLLLHKELDQELYTKRKGAYGFVLGGYDNFSQKSVKSYPGYHVDRFYQMLGLTKDFGKAKWLLAAGASESYEKLNPEIYSARASYNTVWGSLGAASNGSKWRFGIKGLFGYSFIKAHRNVQFLDLKATTRHGMWNASLDGNLSYNFHIGRVQMTPYDLIGYLYGHENDYKERGATGNNLHLSHENISVIRNQLGWKLADPISKSIDVFLDAAWVYEHFFGDKNYKQQFIGSSIVETVTQTVPDKNYVRINAGFQGTHKRFNWRASYTGLYGQNLADSAISLDLGHKF